MNIKRINSSQSQGLRGVVSTTALCILMTAGCMQATSAATLEEVVVTAERRAASALDTPVAISAFNEEQMEAFGVTSARGLQNITPSLVITNIGTTSSVFLRGVGTRLAAPGFEPSVATYVDDRYMARDTSTDVDMVDLERVEVLKGPQGTFFGRNAAGGAIRFITRNPTDKLEGMASVNLGNYGYRELSGVFNAPLSDTVAIRLTAQKADRDDYFDNAYHAAGVPSGIDDEDNLTVRGKLSWDITDRVNLLFTQSYFEKNETRGESLVDLSPPGLGTDVPPVGTGLTGQHYGQVAMNWIKPAKLKDWASEALFTVQLNSFDFVSTTVYSDTDKSVNPLDADATSLSEVGLSVYRPNDTFSQELRLQSNTDSNLRWLVGLYYFEENGEHEGTFDAGLPFLVSQGHDTVKTESEAVFGQIEWDFAADWTLILGGRYTSEDKSAHLVASTRPEVGRTVTAPLPFSADERWKRFTPRATVQYKLGGQMLYTTYARGFKSGGFDYPYLIGGAIKPVVEPEALDMYEVGAKGNFLEKRLQYDASLYYYDYKNLQVARTLSGTSTITENAADARITGLDLNVDWLATENWLLSANMSLLDSEYKNYIVAGRTFAGTPGAKLFDFDAGGHDLLRAPRYSYTLSSRYEFKVADASVPVSLSYSYKSNFYYDFATVSQTDLRSLDEVQSHGYGLLSAGIGYEPASWPVKLRFWGKNLTDKKYYTDVTTPNMGIKAGYADPRTYGAEIQYSF